MRIAIIEDESKTREMLRNMVKSYFPKANVETADGVITGAKMIQSFKPQLLILDIQLVDGTGFDLLELLPERNFDVIFSTAHEEYALKAIKHAAFDYLLKPIDPLELKAAIHNAQAKLNGAINSEENPDKIIVSTLDSMYILLTDDIIRFESEKNYTTIFMADKRRVVVSKPLSEYHSLLKEPMFCRVHRSHIINMSYIDRYDKRDGGFVFMKNGDEIPVSRSAKENFLRLLQG